MEIVADVQNSGSQLIVARDLVLDLLEETALVRIELPSVRLWAVEDVVRKGEEAGIAITPDKSLVDLPPRVLEETVFQHE